MYPILLLLRRPRRSYSSALESQFEWPSVSIIIPVYNAAGIVAEKIRSALSLEYENGLVDVLVVSDGSTDKTDHIVESFADRGVRLVRTGARKGKELAQKVAIAECNGEVIVFTDVGTMTPPESLRLLVAKLGDQEVCATSSEDRFVSADGKPMGEGAYVRYEMWLRRLESERATLVGLSGSYFAARREICDDWNTNVPSDFNVAIECARNGKRAVSVTGAHGIYRDVANPSNEYKRKVRTIVRGMQGLLQKRAILNPFRYGFFSIQLLSHKIMRWATPWGLIMVLLASGLLAGQSSLFFYIFWLQAGMYALAMLPIVVPALKRITLLRLFNYVVTVNIAILHASVLILLGRHMITWEPTERQSS